MTAVRVVALCLPAGMWRGSTVAVKTMVLPARMSGAEKRERMAIMEAAISSTMAHPNIVQVRVPAAVGQRAQPAAWWAAPATNCSAAGKVVCSHASTGWRLQVHCEASETPAMAAAVMV